MDKIHHENGIKNTNIDKLNKAVDKDAVQDVNITNSVNYNANERISDDQ